MVGSGLFISADDYRGMDPALRSKLQDWLDGKNVPTPQVSLAPKVPGSTPDDDDDEDAPADMSVAQAKNLLHGCSDKTKKVLRAVFSKSASSFALGVFAEEMVREGIESLGGAWAGITKRTRTVLGDKDAILFSWEWNDAKKDWFGSSSEMTYRSMRKALSIE